MEIKALVLAQGTDIDWQGFEKTLHDQFGVNAVALKKNGRRRTSGKMLWANGLCALISTSSKGARRICELLRQCLLHKAAAGRTIACDECAAGMYEIVVPVVQIDEVEGFIGVCGRPYLDVGRVYTAFIRQMTDVDQEKIDALLLSLNPIGPRTIREIKQFITGYCR